MDQINGLKMPKGLEDRCVKDPKIDCLVANAAEYHGKNS